MTDINEAVNGSVPALLEFYASWCPHCQRMMPVVEELKKLYEGRVDIIQIDGDAHEDLMDECGVKTYPSWVLYKGGREIWRAKGEKTAVEFKNVLDSLVL